MHLKTRNGRYSPPGGGKIEKVSAPFPFRDLNSKNIYSWLFEVLGYNGVVLGTKDGSVLVGSAIDSFKPGDQAVVYHNSETSYFLSPKKTKAAAIIECITAKGAYGVFKVVLSRSLPRSGQKVVIIPI